MRQHNHRTSTKQRASACLQLRGQSAGSLTLHCLPESIIKLSKKIDTVVAHYRKARDGHTFPEGI